MSSTESLLDGLENIININPSSLSELAKLISKNMGFLNISKSRTRIRPDPFLPSYGAKVDFNPIKKYDDNMSLIAFLAREAISRGKGNREAYNLLASSLYSLKLNKHVIDVVTSARNEGITTQLLEELYQKAVVEEGEHVLVTQAFTELGYENVDQFAFIKLSPFLSFRDWAREVNGTLVSICESKNTVSNTYRQAHQDFEDVKLYKNEIEAKPLIGIQVDDLEVLLGTIPFVGGEGLYELDLLHNHLRKKVVKVADTSLIYNPSKMTKYFFKGKYLVSAVPNNYFNNYFHALIQIASRILLAIENPKFDEYRILIPDNAPAWMMDFFVLSGVELSRIETMPTDGISVIESAMILPMNWDVCPNEISASRRALSINERSIQRDKDYYLIRNDVQNYTRALINEDEIIDICINHGIEVIDPLDYTLSEQIELFSQARTLISSGSSSITNMLFAGSGAEIVILGPRLFWGMLFPDMAAACGHNFSVVFGDFIAGNNYTAGPHNLYASDAESFSNLLSKFVLVDD